MSGLDSPLRQPGENIKDSAVKSGPFSLVFRLLVNSLVNISRTYDEELKIQHVGKLYKLSPSVSWNHFSSIYYVQRDMRTTDDPE